jgi:methylmalonyl-CoA mutase
VTRTDPLAAWRAAAARELRGRDPAALDWTTRDGIELPALAAEPGPLPHQLVEAELAEVGPATPEPVALDAEDLAHPLPAERLAGGSLVLSARCASIPALESLLAGLRAAGLDPARIRGAIECDPIGDAVAAGAEAPDPAALAALPELVRWCAAHLPGVVAIRVRSAPFAERGAPPAQELGLAAAAMLEYVRLLRDRRIGIDVAATRIGLELDVGPELIAELGKLRAARFVWAKLVAAFAPLHRSSTRLHLAARSAPFWFTARAGEANLVRAALAGFAALAAGCEPVELLPYDLRAPGRDPTAGRWLAEGQLRILLHEAKLGRVVDPLAGAGIVELATDRTGRRAWDWLQRVEAAGGLLAALRSGWLREQLATAEAALRDRIARHAQPIVGTSTWCDPDEPEPPNATGTRHASRVFDDLRARVQTAGRPAVAIRILDDSDGARAAAELARQAFAAGGFALVPPTAPAAVDALCAGAAPPLAAWLEREAPRRGSLAILVAPPPDAPPTDLLRLQPGDDLPALWNRLLERLARPR